MKIKCLSKEKILLPLDLQLKNQSPEQDVMYEFLDVGKEYNVYGMILIHGQISYYICDRAHNRFPIARPAKLFEIIDNRLSRYWVFGMIQGFEKYLVWIFWEWINEAYFQDNLTDGEEKEVGIFQAYKKLMDLEFPDSSITEDAQIIDDEWLICSSCIDGWECSSDRDALVMCPKCQKILNNPRYKNRYPGL